MKNPRKKQEGVGYKEKQGTMKENQQQDTSLCLKRFPPMTQVPSRWPEAPVTTGEEQRAGATVPSVLSLTTCDLASKVEP